MQNFFQLIIFYLLHFDSEKCFEDDDNMNTTINQNEHHNQKATFFFVEVRWYNVFWLIALEIFFCFYTIVEARMKSEMHDYIILSKVKGICKGDGYVHSLLSYYLSRLRMTHSPDMIEVQKCT